MQNASKQQSILNSKELFNPQQLTKCGQKFYRYVEPIKESMISRKGLEREVTDHVGMPMTLITRHDIEDSRCIFPSERVAVLQSTVDYERDVERALSSRTAKLQAKYAK